jgi:hypothetical protein
MFDYLLAWLITFGIAWSIANADGPFNVYLRFRRFVEKRYGEHSWQATGVNCPICVGFWVSIPVAFFMDGGFSMFLSSAGFVTVINSLSPD